MHQIYSEETSMNKKSLRDEFFATMLLCLQRQCYVQSESSHWFSSCNGFSVCICLVVSRALGSTVRCGEISIMPGKKYSNTYRRTAYSMATLSSKRHCLLFFPLEGSHGIWPEHLIRSKGRFGFEAKYGTQWFQCRIDKEGIF